MKKILLLLCGAFLLPCAAFARPVSYKGGTTVMQMNDDARSSLHLHYSPTAFTSLGYRGEYWYDEDVWLHGAAMNNLLKRWNKPNSQANIYLRSGIGIAQGNSDSGAFETNPLAYTGLAVDWENRRYFVSYMNRYVFTDNLISDFHEQARIGIAPYIGDYGDIHTWIMLQAEHHPGTDDTFSLTPLLRFFMAEYLLEIGVSDRGSVLANWVIRF